MSKRKGLAKSCQPWKHVCPAMRRKREGALERRKGDVKHWEAVIKAMEMNHANQPLSYFLDKIVKAKIDIKNLEARLAK